MNAMPTWIEAQKCLALGYGPERSIVKSRRSDPASMNARALRTLTNPRF